MPSRRQFLLGCVAAGVAVAAPVGWYGGVYEATDFEITRRTMAIRNLPARLDGRTAVQISDLHLNEADSTHARMIDLINQEKPDHYVFFTGDLVNERAAVGHAVDIFRGIQPPGGTWAVVGNSDRSSGATDSLKSELGSVGVHYLIDASAQTEGLWIVGVNDPSAYVSDVGQAIQDIPKGAPRILLAHSPDIVDQTSMEPPST